MRTFKKLMDYGEALRPVMEEARPLPVVEVPLLEAGRRTPQEAKRSHYGNRRRRG